MDPEVRSKTPGICPRCGMKLVPGIPDPHEYPVHLSTRPAALKPGVAAELDFRIEDPKTLQPVHDFEIVHEKLYHLFVVSQDLQFFAHVHPEKQADGAFKLGLEFPKAGLYRILSDFYPTGGTPQLIASSIIVPKPGGAPPAMTPVKLEADLTPKHAENLDVEISTDPPQPLAGFKSVLVFRLKPDDAIEPYLGTWGHMLAASADLIDMIHTHPFLENDPAGENFKQVQFNLIFPREGVYRVWVQFQRKGVVNTAAFNIPVTTLK